MKEFNFSKVKGIFFDLYGTVLVFNDEEEASRIWKNSFYNLIGRDNNISPDEINTLCDELLQNNVTKEKNSGFTTYETKIKLGFEKRGISLAKENLSLIADETVGSWQNHISLTPDAVDVFTELKKKVKISMITNFDHTPHIKRVIKEHNLDAFLEPIIISDEVGFQKPDPKIFELTLKRTGLKADEIIFVGDSSDDVNGAFFSGIEPVLIKYPQSKNILNISAEINKPVTTINSLSGLLYLINQN